MTANGEVSFASNFTDSSEGTVVEQPSPSRELEDNDAFTRQAHPPRPNTHHEESRETGDDRDGGSAITKNSKKCSTSSDNSTIYVEFSEGDKRNPANFTIGTKWTITIMACISTIFASSTASAYSLGFNSMILDLNCTEFQATIGLSVYPLGFGVVPLVTASLSEEFGRQPLYIGSSIGFILMYMMVALSKNIQTVMLARFLQGAFGSTGATMVGGTIADIWVPKERGLPMSIFALSAVGGTGLGPLVAGWIEMNPRLGWRWIQWYQMIIFFVFLVLAPILLKETRSSILLTRLAQKKRKETGDARFRARIEDERPPLGTLIYVSCTRPVLLMFTEPAVLSFSLWIGFGWGVFFCLIESIGVVFRTLHGFNVGEVGSMFTTMAIGSSLGFLTNMHQETLYHKHFPTRGPEARLHWACFAAFLFPASMFMYAWSASSSVHWIVQAIAITLFVWAVFVMYLSVFSYLADCYGPYASSALAGQSLARNLMGTAFPLFTHQMFDALGYKWANSIFAFIAVIMIPIPYALYFYGPEIRRRSRFSSMVMGKHG